MWLAWTDAGDSVRATSANVDLVGAYAQRGGAGGNTLYLLLFNKDVSAQSVPATVAGGLSGSASLFRFTGSSRLAAAGSAAPSGGTLTLTLPARSATLAVVALPVTTPPPAATSFHAATPCRFLDTRAAAGPALAANVRREFVLTGTCGIPATAAAVSANVTVTAPSSAGSLVAFPADLTSAPGTNTLSFGAGQTRANNAMLLLARDASGRCAFTPAMPSGAVHLVVDVNGWWE